MTTIPEQMCGVYLTGHGGTDKLEFREDIPVPKPGPNEVLIKVGAAAVNNTDLNTRLAWYSKSDGDSSDASWSGNSLHFPRIQGADVCGRIVAVGEEVSRNRLNNRVLIEPCIRETDGEILDQPWYFGSECDGGFAEYAVVAARHAHDINSQFSDIELASFPCSYSTAENMLTRTNVGVDDTVLVTGASGGVGSAAIQLANARGASVVAITSPAKADRLMELGAVKVLMREDNLVQVLGKNSVDVVIDLVAGKQWPDLLEVLKPFGRYGVAGAIGGPIVNLDVRTLYLKDLSFYGCTVLGESIFANLVERIESGAISPLVAKTYSLRRLSDAQSYFETKKYTGKLVIDLVLTD